MGEGNLELKADGETLDKVMIAEILKAMSPKIQEQLLQHAIEELLGKRAYGRDRKIYEGISVVIDKLCEEVCREVIAGRPEIRETIRKLYEEALASVFDGGHDETVARIQKAMLNNLLPSK